jgi:hypothetical protein
MNLRKRPYVTGRSFTRQLENLKIYCEALPCVVSMPDGLSANRKLSCKVTNQAVRPNAVTVHLDFKFSSFRLRDFTGKWTERSRLPMTGSLTRNNFRLARHPGTICQADNADHLRITGHKRCWLQRSAPDFGGVYALLTSIIAGIHEQVLSRPLTLSSGGH